MLPFFAPSRLSGWLEVENAVIYCFRLTTEAFVLNSWIKDKKSEWERQAVVIKTVEAKGNLWLWSLGHVKLEMASFRKDEKKEPRVDKRTLKMPTPFFPVSV